MSRTDSGSGAPRAVIHKRILDVADARPDASLEAIADEVAGATTDLVQRVFDEYGDPATTPADQQTSTETMNENGHHSDQEAPKGAVDPASLPTKQRETLRLVHDHPEWSQAEVAQRLDVSRATVSRRLNDIPGFEWGDREAFTRSVFDDEPGSGDATVETVPDDGNGSERDGNPERDDASGSDAGESSASPDTDGETPPAGAGDDGTVEAAVLAEFEQRLDEIESRVAGHEGDGTVDLPPGLAHKVVHACMESDRITEDEELELLEALMQ